MPAPDMVAAGQQIEAIKKQAAATLAAAIVIARRAESVSEIRKAWQDAYWIANPERGNSRYDAWITQSAIEDAARERPGPEAMRTL